MTEYNAKDDGEGSYLAAIEAKREKALAAIKREVVIGDCRLLLGDCAAILPAIGAVDAVVTDPPYGIGFPYNSYEDTEDNLRQLIDGYVPICRVLAKRVIITPGVSNVSLYPRPDWTAAWTWETTATYGALGYNQWQPVLFYGADLKGFGSVNGALKSDRIHFTGGTAKIDHAEGAGHTCPKPLSFVNRLVSRFSNDGETILDPFLGSGTTGVSCAKMGRKFIGIEIDPGYFDIACERIRKAYAQPDMFIEARAPEPVQEAMPL